MNALRILIAEHETSVAGEIKNNLIEWGYQVVAIATSGGEAEQLYRKEQPDLTLIDLQLDDSKSSFNLAYFIRKQAKPFIFLTSSIDRYSMDAIKQTFPAACLYKPIQPENLYTAIEIATHRYVSPGEAKGGILLLENNKFRVVSFEDILYVQADHVYVQIHTISTGKIVQRRSLTHLLEQLPVDQFVQTHRSFAVNTQHVRRWDKHHLYLRQKAIPLSRARRKAVLSLIDSS